VPIADLSTCSNVRGLLDDLISNSIIAHNTSLGLTPLAKLWSRRLRNGQTVEGAKECFEKWIGLMLESVHCQGYKAPNIRRVYIPKPGKTV
jgi:hypothetical protein